LLPDTALVVVLFAVAVFVVAAFDVVVVLAPGLAFEPELPALPPEPPTIETNATTTAISAKGARKRAGLLLVR
jgi:hypothetical protein